MRDEAYRVVVDSELKAGAVSYGELLVPGETDDEVLISVHSCHPSLANDNLSGLTVAVELAQRQMRRPGRHGVRFLFVPGTIGAITWLALNEGAVARIRHGLVLTCIGDRGHFHYKRSRRGDAIVDRAVARVLADRGATHELMPFTPFGYDERQYGSPGFDLPVGCFMRSPNGSFPEYHTSADDPGFVAPEALAESYAVLAEILDVLDAERLYCRVDGRGEPQLGRRGLYRAISGQEQAGGATQAALTWFLNLADGRHSLLDMCDRAGLPFREIRGAAQLALDADLVRNCP
jgi:aminopeptidase-like protein